MQALHFTKTGSLEYLQLTELEKPIPNKKEVIVRVRAAAINPSDVKNVLGKMQETTTPRIPGRDFAGTVVSNSVLKGKSVFGTGGLLGFSQNGTHAEFVSVPEDGLVEIPDEITFAEATAMALAYLTAWQALAVAGKLQKGETVLITGASGAVGGAAVRVAEYLGAKVIGTFLSSNELSLDLRNRIFSINLNNETIPEKVSKITKNQGVNLVLDVVGGELFEPCLRSLSAEGRQVAIASSGNSKVYFDLTEFYHKQIQLIGVDTLKLSNEQAANILKAILPGIKAGKFLPNKIDEIRINDAIAAYHEINDHKAKNKKVIIFPEAGFH
jgi:NADPH2:quinone reductase